MPTVSSEQCYAHVSRLRGRVVVITGASSGIGRACSLEFAKHGAKLVLGDIAEEGVKALQSDIAKLGGQACYSICDVSSWEDQVRLFEVGQKRYGRIDVVLANAGISDTQQNFEELVSNPEGPLKPDLKTLEVNLIGPIYTARLAMWHFMKVRSLGDDPDMLQALIFTGSASTFGGGSPLYSTTKAGLLGHIKGIKILCKKAGIRVGLICPFWVDTPIFKPGFTIPWPGWEFTRMEDVLASFVAAITDPSQDTDFGAYILPSNRGVYRCDQTGYSIGAEPVLKAAEEFGLTYPSFVK